MVLHLLIFQELLNTQVTASNSLFGIKKDTKNGCNFFRLINFSDFFVVSFNTSVT